MRALVLVFAFFIIVVGIVGVVAPDRLMTIGRSVITPVGLYVIAAVRVGMGLVLMLVAPTSRAPKTLRACGMLVMVAGFATPLIGVDRTRGILDWEAAQGTALLRSVAVLLMAIGGSIAFAVAGGRRELSDGGCQ